LVLRPRKCSPVSQQIETVQVKPQTKDVGVQAIRELENKVAQVDICNFNDVNGYGMAM